MINSKSGYLIIYVMVLTFITMAIGLSVLSVSSTQYTHVVDDVYRQDVAYGAKACASIVAERLNDNPSFSGFTNQVVFDDLNNSQGRVNCTATVSNGANDTKNVNITTQMRRFAADPHPISYKMRAVLQVGDGSAGGSDYLKGGVLAGHAGFYTMYVGTILTDQINIIGKFYGVSGNLSNVGTSDAPIEKITVANVACGSSTNWPQPCTDQPVVPWYGTIFQPIFATDVCAPGQSVAHDRFIYGINTDCEVAATATPRFDKASFVNKMTNTIDASTLFNTGPNGCVDVVPVVPGYPQYGVRYYGREVNVPANTRITGDLTMNYYHGSTNINGLIQSDCTIVFEGDAYLTGNTYGLNVNFKVSDSATDNVTVAMNSKFGIGDQQKVFPPSSSGKLMHLISFYSNNPSCSNSDILPSASQNTCLSNSQAMQTAQITPQAIPVDPAIVFDGNSQTYDWSGVTFYSYYGTVHLGCNRVTVAAVGGQGVSGGCLNVGLIGYLTTTGNSPTFGGLIPSVKPKYKVVDLLRM